MTKPNNELTLEDAVKSIAPTITLAIQDWINKQNPAEITKNIHAMLNKSRDEVAAKLLGMNKRWGDQWEIDHCNGRNGESVMGDYLKNTQTAAIQTWIDSLDLANVKPFSAKELADIRSEYRHRVINKVQDMVRSQAERDAAKLVADISNTDFVANIIKTQKLIGAEFQLPVPQES